MNGHPNASSQMIVPSSATAIAMEGTFSSGICFYEELANLGETIVKNHAGALHAARSETSI
jgi:hypothetical protein